MNIYDKTKYLGCAYLKVALWVHYSARAVIVLNLRSYLNHICKNKTSNLQWASQLQPLALSVALLVYLVKRQQILASHETLESCTEMYVLDDLWLSRILL